MDMTPKFLQGLYPFTGEGLDKPIVIDAGLSYIVPGDRRAQMVYLRAGNSSSELICLMLMRDGVMMRLFPIGAKGDSHVSLAVVEDLEPETKLDLLLAAPAGVSGTVVIDIGLLEI